MQGTMFSNGTWIIDPSNFTIDVQYALTVTVSGIGSDPRSVVAQTEITPEPPSIFPSGSINLVCPGGPCPSALNPSKPFSLSLTLTNDTMKNSTVTWFSSTVPTIPTQSGPWSTNSVFSVAGDLIPAGTSSVNFYCNITFCISGVCTQGQASLPVTFLLPPACAGGFGNLWWVTPMTLIRFLFT